MSPALDPYQYLLLMAACFVITLPLEPVFGARAYRRPKQLLRALIITAAAFSIWDIVAIQYDLWTYSPQFTTGIILPFDFPLEELVFFLIIPLCGVLTYEAVGNVLRWLGGLRRKETTGA